MNTDIANRLIQVLNDIDKIKTENKLTTVSKKKKVKVKENLDMNSSIYEDIIMTSSPFYLPKTLIPKKVLRIINLGASGLKVIANENETIYHTFYSPRGSTHIIIPENSWVDVLFIEKSGGEKIWLSK